MKGATTEPSVNTIRVPNNPKKMIMGSSQNFFLSLKNSQISLAKSNIIVFLQFGVCDFVVPYPYI